MKDRQMVLKQQLDQQTRQLAKLIVRKPTWLVLMSLGQLWARVLEDFRLQVARSVPEKELAVVDLVAHTAKFLQEFSNGGFNPPRRDRGQV